MPPPPGADGFYKLTPEQSRRLAASPSVKIEGLAQTTERREFFESRGIDFDSLRIDDPQIDTHHPQPTDFRRPQSAPLAAEGQIRILVLEPGDEGDPIKCQLHHHTLQKRHSYDPNGASYNAISYTWTAPIRRRYYTPGPSPPGQEFTPESWLASAMSGSAYTIIDGTSPTSFAPQPDQVDEQELMRPVNIIINKTICDVSGNLSAALHQLRLPDHARNLWVDAICIDLANLRERGQQVRQMDRIYQGC